LNTCFSLIKQVSGRAIIQVAASGENAIILFPGANHNIDQDFIRDTFNEIQFTGNDWIVIQNEISSMDFLLKESRKRGKMKKKIPTLFQVLL